MVEYYKIKFKADAYTKVYGKLVGELWQNLDSLEANRGVVPFERFYLGGDGLANFSMDGRETIQLRGYPNNSLTPVDERGAEQIQQPWFQILHPISRCGVHLLSNHLF
jgi:outer membrane protein insertion porin family